MGVRRNGYALFMIVSDGSSAIVYFSSIKTYVRHQLFRMGKRTCAFDPRAAGPITAP